MNKISLYFIAFIFSALIILPQQASAASNIVFRDNFNDNDFSDWEVTRNAQWSNPSQSCRYGSQQAEWQTISGKLGIKINGPACITDIIPKKFNLTNDTNYRYSVDIEYKNTATADRNIIFKYKSPVEWYGFHSYGSSLSFEKIISDYYRLEWLNYPFQANQTYHFDIDFVDDRITLHINNTKIGEFDDTSPFLNQATIALSAGVGANPNSEVWFDNVVVTEINDEPNLNVPLIKQDDPLWKTEVYDNANLWYPSDPSIARWGCALTSTVMVLKHYGIDKLPNNSLLTPKSLNEWMKQQPTGYMNGGNFNWYVIPKLVEQLQANDMIPNFENNSLEYHFDKSPNRIQQLSNDLENNIPGILQVILNSTTNDSHFVVAKGIQDNTFILNDPLWERTVLTDTYNNDFYRLNRFVPSDSDLSYLVLETNQKIEVSVTDSNGDTIGDHYLQEPIADPYNLSIDMGNPYKIYIIQKPDTGDYILKISSNTNSNYVINMYLYDKNANDKKLTLEGITSTSSDFYTIKFNKDAVDESQNQKVVTFQSTIDDVNEAIALKLINRGLGRSVISLLKSTEKDVNKDKRISSFVAGKKLDVIDKLLEKSRYKKYLLNEDAYQILKHDIGQLKSNLQ